MTECRAGTSHCLTLPHRRKAYAPRGSDRIQVTGAASESRLAWLGTVRRKGLPRPLLVLGVSEGGVRFPLAKEPARLIFLLLSPAERAEEHLRALADIARLLTTPGRVEALLGRFAPGTSLDWLHVDD